MARTRAMRRLPRRRRGDGEIEIEPLDDCPEAIAQWASFGEREDNWFSRNHDSDKTFAMRNGGQRERE